MKFINKKTLVATAIAASLGASGAANAAAVTEWLLTDFDGDGLESDFAFYSAPPGNSGNQFTGDVAAITVGTEMAAGSFSTGFDFGGTGQFVPFVRNAGGTGSIVADVDAMGTVSFSSLDFGGTFGGTDFFLAPNAIGDTTSATTLLADGSYGVVVTYISTIVDPGGAFNNFQANWRLEGKLCTATSDAGACDVSVVPVPAAVWLFGSGLLGLVGVARRRKTA